MLWLLKKKLKLKKNKNLMVFKCFDLFFVVLFSLMFLIYNEKNLCFEVCLIFYKNFVTR